MSLCIHVTVGWTMTGQQVARKHTDKTRQKTTQKSYFSHHEGLPPYPTLHCLRSMTNLDGDRACCVGPGREDRCHACPRRRCRVVLMRLILVLVTLSSTSVLHVRHCVSAFSPMFTNLPPRITSRKATTTTATPFPRTSCRPSTSTALAITPSLDAAGTAGLAAVAKFYKAFPLVAGFLTASTKAAFADSMAQYRDVCTTEFNVKRNLSMVLYSGVVLGVLCEIMYNKIFPILFQTTGSTTVAAAAAGGGRAAAIRYVIRAIKMTLFDGFINAPFLWLPPAYITQAVVFRYPKRDALIKYWIDVKENGLLRKYWSLWLPASFCNFMVVPPHFRVAFVAAVSFFWMIILSIVANNRDDEDIDTLKESCPVEPEPRLLNPRAMD